MMVDLPSYGPTNRIRLGAFLRSRPLLLNYTGSERLTDFQVKCILTPSDIPFEKLRADKQDLLFVNNNNEAIPYWIEKSDSTQIIVWLKISEIISGKEVLWLYYGNGNFSGVSNASMTFLRIIDGLVGSWRFDEGAGSTAYDSSGNDNDGEIHDAVWIDGKFERALEYNGSNSYTEIPHNNILDLSDEYSISFWFYPYSSPDTVAYGIRKIRNYEIRFYSTNKVLFTFIDESGHTHNLWSSPVQLNQWHHVVTTFSKFEGKARLFLNNNLEDEDDISESTQTPEASLFVGGLSSGLALYGIIDELIICDKPFSDDEINDIYNYYAYTTEDYPGKVLVRKYAETEPKVIL